MHRAHETEILRDLLKQEFAPNQFDRFKLFLELQIMTVDAQLFTSCNVPNGTNKAKQTAKAFPEALEKRNSQFSMGMSKFSQGFDESHNSMQQTIFRDFKLNQSYTLHSTNASEQIIKFRPKHGNDVQLVPFDRCTQLAYDLICSVCDIMHVELDEIDRGSRFYGLDIEPSYMIQNSEDLTRIQLRKIELARQKLQNNSKAMEQ